MATKHISIIINTASWIFSIATVTPAWGAAPAPLVVVHAVATSYAAVPCTAVNL